MHREWFTERLLQIDIATLVVVVLVGIAAITSRLARDPSDSVVRWWQDRARAMASIADGPGGSVAQGVPAAPVGPAGPAAASKAHTPEWLERLIGRHAQDEVRTVDNSQVHHANDTGRRVA